MNKCIILSRVSTERQTLEQQTELLVNKAKQDGYDKDNIIVIEDKESAIKLGVNEREGLRKLKREIEKDSTIDCVYVFEISRIGRRMDVLIEMRDFFVERKIQLFIYNNNQYLLDEKKELTFAGGLIFTLFSQFAESEMKDKKDRMKRGQLHKKNQNRYIGGRIAYGYMIGDNDEIVINEKEADIVREVFSRYASGESIATISKDLYKRGEMKSENERAVNLVVGNMIHRKGYIGIQDKKGYPYPQIVSKELFDKVQEISHDKFKPKTDIGNIYYLQGLIRSKKSNRLLGPFVGMCLYRINDVFLDEHLVINMNFIDSLAWHLVKEIRKNNSSYDRETERKEASKMLEEAKKKLQMTDTRIERIQKELDRLLTLFVKGKISEDKYDEEVASRNHEIFDIELEKDEYNHTITEMMNRIAYTQYFLYEKKLDEPKSDEEIYNIIHQEIDKILIEKTDEKWMTRIEFYFKHHTPMILNAYRSSKRRWVKDEEGNKIKFEIVERYKRKYKSKK